MKIINEWTIDFTVNVRNNYYECNNDVNNEANKCVLQKCMEDDAKWNKKEDIINECNFDFSVLKNAANCIVYAIYCNNDDPGGKRKLMMYLKCISISIAKIAREMSDVLIRIYACDTIKKIVDNMGPIAIELLDQIMNASNVEYYSIKFDSAMPEFARHKIRAFRLLPMCDENINACLIKDSDSIFTKIEAHNFKKFIASSEIIYVINTHYDITYSFESPWSVFTYFYPLYDVYFHSLTREKIKTFSLIKTNDNYYPTDIILLGMFGSKLHFSKKTIARACELFEKIKINKYFSFPKEIFLDEYIANNIYSPIFMYPSNTPYKFSFKQEKNKNYLSACALTTAEIDGKLSNSLEKKYESIIRAHNESNKYNPLLLISIMHDDDEECIAQIDCNEYIRCKTCIMSEKLFNLIDEYYKVLHKKNHEIYNDCDSTMLYNINTIDPVNYPDFSEEGLMMAWETFGTE